MLFYKFLFFFPDFLEIQRSSFYHFVKYKLGLEFLKIHPFVNSRNFNINKNFNKNFKPNLIHSQKLNLRNEQQNKFSYEFLTEKNKKLNFYNNNFSFKKTSIDKTKNIIIFFLYKNYKFIKPTLNIKECIISSKTYCSEFYFPIQFINYFTKTNKIQWVFLGTLPLLTRRGHFIVNGAPRIIVNQIVRSPGVYFHKQTLKNKKSIRLYYAEIISKSGPWVRIEIDKKKNIWISFQQNKISKIPLLYFIQNFNQKYIDYQIFLYEKFKQFNLKVTLYNKIFALNSEFLNNLMFYKKKKKIKNFSKKNIDFFFRIKKLRNQFHKDYFLNLSKNNRNFNYNINIYLKIYNQFNFLNLNENFSSKYKNIQINFPKKKKKNNSLEYNLSILLASSPKNRDSIFILGKNGRIDLNRKLGLSLNSLTLTPIDFLAISDFLFKLTENSNNNSKIISIDNIDDLKNRQLKTIEELLQNQFTRGLSRLKNNFEKNLKKSSLFLIINILFNSDTSFLNFFSLKKKNTWLNFKTINEKKSYNDNMNKLAIKRIINNSYKKRSFEKRYSYLSRIDFFKNKKKVYSYFNKNLQLNFSKINFKRYFIYKEILLYKKSLILLKKNKYIEVLKNIKTKKKTSEDSFLFLLNSQPINSTLKEFFHSNQLSQYLDQTNSLAEITHKRRISCLGIGGVDRETAGMEIRSIHSSYYGRICPIETPEGKNAGLVNSLTTGTIINKKKLLETPFIQVYKQYNQNQRKVFFFSVENQETINVFFNQKLPKIKNSSVSIINFKTGKFCECQLNLINFIAFNAQQFISVATTCIPFIEHNDANRALMGSNMQRQALPLISVEQPQITTLNSFRVISDLKDIPNSSHSGVILYTSKKKTFLYHYNINYLNNYTSFLDLTLLNNISIKNSKQKLQIKQVINFLNLEINYI